MTPKTSMQQPREGPMCLLAGRCHSTIFALFDLLPWRGAGASMFLFTRQFPVHATFITSPPAGVLSLRQLPSPELEMVRPTAMDIVPRIWAWRLPWLGLPEPACICAFGGCTFRVSFL